MSNPVNRAAACDVSESTEAERLGSRRVGAAAGPEYDVSVIGAKNRSLARRKLAGVLLVGAFLATGSIAACSSSSSSTVAPTTGILIRAETLTSGRGCGRSPTQLFKYAVVVYGLRSDLVGSDATGLEQERSSYDRPITSNVFDCFADGTFISLDATGNNTTYRLEVFAFNESAYTLNSANIDRSNRLAADHAAALRSSAPTWTTVCMGTQQENVQALASCDPLAAGLGGLVGGGNLGPTRITLATDTFNVAGRVASCGAGSTDAGSDADVTDAASDASSDAGEVTDGGETDAAAPLPPITFAQVRVRPRVRSELAGPTEIVACPTPYAVDVTANPATYQLDVELLDSAGNLVAPGAQTVCSASSQPGLSISAVCP